MFPPACLAIVPDVCSAPPAVRSPLLVLCVLSCCAALRVLQTVRQVVLSIYAVCRDSYPDLFPNCNLAAAAGAATQMRLANAAPLALTQG